MPVRPRSRVDVAVLVRNVRARLAKGYEPESLARGGPKEGWRARYLFARRDVAALLDAVVESERIVSGLVYGFAATYGGNEHVEGAAKNMERIVVAALERAVEILAARVGLRTEVLHLKRKNVQEDTETTWCGRPGRVADRPHANCVDCFRLVCNAYDERERAAYEREWASGGQR